ncbi:MAG: hypothetical protein OdinLCB4_000220 [Candidatus Odinarchaeum yellowstonii]|uniref:Uncharacterized protein n=1 Tax=Odinarchaeota yellowstonii (strain LCB_4) TaxID=1841599 RepID=A0AAF0D2B7_ODILC|nr:MAG: hypothetical protein OdinLCB4_000220 [Candidatus Odinarchaeum yellowstonii]
MEKISKKTLYRKKKLSGLLGFIFIILSIISAFILGYPYSAFLIEVGGSYFFSELNSIFILGGLALYFTGLFFAALGFYVDRTPFNIEHPVRRRHSSLPMFFTWLLAWNLIDIFIIGNFARTSLAFVSFWMDTLNDFVVRYVFVLGTIIMFMLILMTFAYNKIIPDKSILTPQAFKRKLIYVGVAWSIIIIVFTLGVFVNIV